MPVRNEASGRPSVGKREKVKREKVSGTKYWHLPCKRFLTSFLLPSVNIRFLTPLPAQKAGLGIRADSKFPRVHSRFAHSVSCAV